MGRSRGGLTSKIHALVDYRHAEYPEVSWLTNVDKDGNIDWFGVKRATDWHTDSPYEEVPPVLAILHAKEVPSSKGGTMFADMRAAYDALSPEMKERLATLGYEVVASTPEEFAIRIKTEIETWAKVIRAANIKAE